MGVPNNGHKTIMGVPNNGHKTIMGVPNNGHKKLERKVSSEDGGIDLDWISLVK